MGNHRMNTFFGFAGRPIAEFLHYDRAVDDLRMQGEAYKKYCGRLPGHWEFDSARQKSVFVLDGDKTKLQTMCATSMTPDNLNLCLGSGGIIAQYLGTASRAYARAMHLLDGLSTCSSSSAGASKYGYPCENDLGFLQLLESSWYWRFGQTRLNILTDYTVLVAACHHEKPLHTSWNSHNGNVGLAALSDAKQTLESVVNSMEADLEKLKSKGIDAALRLYKKNHISAFQTTVCKTDGKGTSRNEKSKNYVLLRDTNSLRPRSSPKIDLSEKDQYGIYNVDPQTVARQCFGDASGRRRKKCNDKAKNHPMYQKWQAENWPCDDERNFAVGCYPLGDKGSPKISEYELLHHWEPERPLKTPSIGGLDRLEGPQGRSIGYSTDKYLDIFIRPVLSGKYDQLFAHVNEALSTIRGDSVLGAMQSILTEHQGGRRLRGGADAALAEFTKLRLDAAVDLEEIYA